MAPIPIFVNNGFSVSWSPVPSYPYPDYVGFTSDMTYTALWTPIRYNISYNNVPGGSLPADTSNPSSYYVYDEFILVNPVAYPGRPELRFVGWTGTGLSQPTKTVTIHNGSTGNRAYTAAWAQFANYTVIHMKQIYQPGYGLRYIQQELEVLSGGEKLPTAAVARTYKGHDAVPFEQKTIAPSGATVVYIYYASEAIRQPSTQTEDRVQPHRA